MQKYVIALYIRLSIEDYKYDSLSIENQSLVLHEYAASMPEALNAEIIQRQIICFQNQFKSICELPASVYPFHISAEYAALPSQNASCGHGAPD